MAFLVFRIAVFCSFLYPGMRFAPGRDIKKPTVIRPSADPLLIMSNRAERMV